MNLINLITSATSIFEQGKSINASTALTNAEVTASVIYGLLSITVTALGMFGVNLNVEGTDLHTVANGWSATISLVYAAYRAATNPNTGVKPK